MELPTWLERISLWASSEKFSRFLDAEAVQRYRQGAIVNTLVLTAPNIDLTTLPERVSSA
jgi:hypothetical protein